MLEAYLHEQAAEFLRSLRLHSESGADAEAASEAARLLRRSARRIIGALHTFRPLTDTAWADELRAELSWLSSSLASEHAYAARLSRLLSALHRLSGGPETPGVEAPRTGTAAAGSGPDTGRGAGGAGPGSSTVTPPRQGGQQQSGQQQGRQQQGAQQQGGQQQGRQRLDARGQAVPSAPASDGATALTVGAARAGALLERQLTLARTRAHSAALQVLGSSRFHAVADAVAVLASEVPLDPVAAARPAAKTLPPLAEQAHRRLAEAVAALPLSGHTHPYGTTRALAATEHQDAPWLQVRLLLRFSRYAQEVLRWGDAPGPAQGARQDEREASGAPAVRDGREAREGPREYEPDARLAAASRALERHRDAAEAAGAAAAAARTPRIAPATAYALGVLHADQRHEVEAARFAFGALWLPASGSVSAAASARASAAVSAAVSVLERG
ncbi:CHAD domain-containing protein [Streptomyces sp. H27-D2]|uniref:CHAD domain-containing protein n=1 Tax=Streptomyces sp. H27-D2 TaxID=3046304 RepID=UPI003FA7C6F4